jgi:glycine/D-amino acid oxidase-like deaminating enzyme
VTTQAYDVAVIGGGIVGVSAAAFLAEAGRRVVLFEREEIAAAASGRNSGAVQHPFDPSLADLYRETVAHYRELSDAGSDFKFPAHPDGLLLLSFDADAVAAAASAIDAHSVDVAATVLSPEQLRELEPAVAPDVYACRLETGYPVAPEAATKAFAARARRAGATIEIGDAAEAIVEGGRASGVRLSSGKLVVARNVLVAAGPWTPSLVPGWAERPPIQAVWGVVVSAGMAQPPRAVLEELGIDRPGLPPDELFSLVTAGSDTSVGSTFLARQPDPAQRAPAIMKRAARYVPALADARVLRLRACARPVAFDSRPLIGSVPGVDGLFVCAGHGPWGISTGPASARIVVDEILGRASAPADLAAARWSQPVGASRPIT